MKRNSLTTALACICLTMTASTAFAVITNPTQNQTQTNQTQQQFNPTMLPGQEFYNSTQGTNNNPFFGPTFNTNPFNPTNQNPQSNTLPGTTVPGTVPNPNPNLYPNQNDGRNRVDTIPSTQFHNSATNPDQNRWRLGVYSKDLDIGCKIMDVVPGLAAQRAGLEAGDLIVGVNGYQVGYINGELYDCATEFERNADAQGWVTLLVQNVKDKTLMNVPVQLDSRMSTLKGSIALQTQQQLPPNSVAVIELREVIQNGSAPVTFATKRIENVSGYSIPFEIDYDPAHISSYGNYVVFASIASNGQEVYRTAQNYPVLQQGTNRPVAITVQTTKPTYQQIPTPIDKNAQIAQIVKWFNQYLSRDPSDRELAVWLSAIQQGYPMSQVQLELAGHTQFFNRCNRDPQTYVTKVHELLVGRVPNTAEMDYWLARYNAQNGIRSDLAREIQDAVGIR